MAEEEALESSLDEYTMNKLKDKFKDVEEKLQDQKRRLSPISHAAILVYRKTLDKLMNKLIESMKMRLYVRYRDMFAQVCNKVRTFAEKNRIPG
jgi:hypothetical protein